MILNPFSTDAFNMVALTAAINKIPNTYGRLEQLNRKTETPAHEGGRRSRESRDWSCMDHAGCGWQWR